MCDDSDIHNQVTLAVLLWFCFPRHLSHMNGVISAILQEYIWSALRRAACVYVGHAKMPQGLKMYSSNKACMSPATALAMLHNIMSQSVRSWEEALMTMVSLVGLVEWPLLC